MIFYDTETCGLAGPVVLLQWAEDDGEIHLHNVWVESFKKTLTLIEWMMSQEVVGFNLAFDHFQISKIYNMFRLALEQGLSPDDYPDEHIEFLADLESKARFKWCLKPKKSCDLFLLARKSHYQELMDRNDISIRRVPELLAHRLAEKLEELIPMKDIYFARDKKARESKWKVKPREDQPGFMDIVLNFNPSMALKALAADALGYDAKGILKFSDVELPESDSPEELLYAPFSSALAGTPEYHFSWPFKIKTHIEHWQFSENAKKYAELDIVYTRELYKHFGSPAPGDTDSELAICVASCRWKGYAVNLEGLPKLVDDLKSKQRDIPTAPKQAAKWLDSCMTPAQKIVASGSTDKKTLKSIASWTGTEPARRAGLILEARQAHYDQDIYKKLILAKRFHASFKVIGTLSGRMAGADDLNAQGISNTPVVRQQFTLADPDMVLCGGDFDGFEVALAEAAYNDPDLRAALLSGKKIHAMFGVHLFPGNSYEDIVKSKTLYNLSKQGVFALLYGGDAGTLHRNLGIDIEIATEAFNAFCLQFPGVAMARKRIHEKFCALRQPGGEASAIYWNDPEPFIESLFGFRRYFTLENKMCKALYELARSVPKEWTRIPGQVIRRTDRVQSVSGATRSALYGAAFGIQSGVMRAAANHEIQSTGAQITKELQRAIWDLQPTGVNEWHVQPMNIHDEVVCPARPDFVGLIRNQADSVVDRFKSRVPMLAIKWVDHMDSWDGKKGDKAATG
jgi:hypothetical protein